MHHHRSSVSLWVPNWRVCQRIATIHPCAESLQEIFSHAVFFVTQSRLALWSKEVAGADPFMLRKEVM